MSVQRRCRRDSETVGARVISRDEVKRLFREGKADVLLCTDAAAERR
jgi:hypothetical protein